MRAHDCASARMSMAGAAIVSSYAIPETPETIVTRAEEEKVLRERVAAALAELGKSDRALVVKTTVEAMSLVEPRGRWGLGTSVRGTG